MRRLLTIPISHYCEKARWALERAGLVYREEPHLQMLHWAPARRAGGRTTVPLLVTDDGVFPGSHAILVYADAKMPRDWRLYPHALGTEAEQLERSLDQDYGAETRRLFYAELAHAPQSFAIRLNNQTAPSWEGATMRLALPLALRVLLRYLDLRPQSIARAADRVAHTLDDMAARLADGRLYLCGDQLSAADITFAALSAPLFAPREYGVPLPPKSAFPDHARRLFAKYGEHPAVQFAERLYTRERRRTVPFELELRG